MDQWRILAYKFEPSGNCSGDGHAMASRYGSSLKKIEFVDNDGFLIDIIREDVNGHIKEYKLNEFNFVNKKSVSIFVYKNGIKEYRTN